MARTANVKSTEQVEDEAVVIKEPAHTPSVQSVEMKRRALLHAYKAEEKMTVNISPMYASYFGKIMTVSINGITVAIPCDGKTYQVPKTHAIEAVSRIRKVDAFITRKSRMQDVVNNFERTAGELKFY